jgi:hypothetical protein
MSYEHQLLAQKTKTWKTEKILIYPKNGRTAFSHGWKKDKIIDNGIIISWYKCHFNCSGELLLKKKR